MPIPKKIKIMKNGPYFVYGAPPLAPQTIGVDAEGQSTE